MVEETKKAAAKKAPAKKAPAAKEAPVKETPVKKTPAKKTPAKEVPTKEIAAKDTKKGDAKIVNRLKTKYSNEVVQTLMQKHNYKSIMQVPGLEKIVVNIGVGDATSNSKLLDDSLRELGEITGQKPVATKAKKSVASFKLREGQAIGCKVTLRGNRMYEFLDKLVSIALPRVRDFRGVSKNAFDGRGNYTLGIKEQLIFPEINYDKVNKIRGMDIIIVTTAKTDAEAFTLLEALGMPFHK